MKDQTYRVYGYRWVVLGVFMLINLTIQMLWITYSPIIPQAAEFYNVSESLIVFLGPSHPARRKRLPILVHQSIPIW